MNFSELVDIDELRQLCESFTAMSGAVTAILDLEGNVLVASGWQEICTRFHRVHPETALRCRESDTALAGELTNGESYSLYKCKNGLVDVAVPITIAGEHIANFFTGQFFLEPPDREYFARQAEEFGFDRDAYMAALDRVPIYSGPQVELMMHFLANLARLIGETGLARKQAEEANVELRRHAQSHVQEETLRFIAQRGWLAHTGDFLAALAAFLGKTLAVDYVVIDRLAADEPGVAETVALYAKGTLLPAIRYSLSNTPCENVMGKALCCYPSGVQTLFPADQLLAEMGVESYAGVPLWDSEGSAIGLIAVMDHKPIFEGTTLTNILQLVATSAAAALERERWDENIRLNLARQKALLDVYQEMPTASVSKIISIVVDKCVNMTGSILGFVGLISDDGQRMEAYIWSREVMENCPLDSPLTFPLGTAGLWAEPVRQHKVVIVNDYLEQNPLKKGYPAGHLELVRFMGVPVVDNGRVVAVAGVANKPVEYAETDHYSVSLLMEGMWEIIKRKRAEDDLRALNEQLERRVRERTAELAVKNSELERLNKLFVGRELKMVELKEQIKKMENRFREDT